jgi:hypothetical protein
MQSPEPRILVQNAPAQQESRAYATSIFRSDNPNDSKLASASTEVKVDGKKVLFAVPSHAALCLNLSHEAYVKAQIIELSDIFQDKPYGRAAEEGLPLLFDLFEQLFLNIVFAFTALEAFANQSIPDDFIFTKLRQDKKFEESYNKLQIERHLSLDNKLSEVLPQITGVELIKGTPIWTEYANLRDIRDRIIHVKTADLGVKDAKETSIWADLLRLRKTDSSLVAHKVIKHFPQKHDNSSPVASGRNQWIKEFPFVRRAVK